MKGYDIQVLDGWMWNSHFWRDTEEEAIEVALYISNNFGKENVRIHKIEEVTGW